MRSGLVASLLFAASIRLANAAEPDLVLNGTITNADYQTYRSVPFVVPAGVTRVSIEFSCTARELRTTLDLGLFDGERFRGWSGGNKSSFTISAEDATPSYLAGPIRPGTWTLVLGVPNIRKGVSSEFIAQVYFVHDGQPNTLAPVDGMPIRRGAGWYRGDLHLHTAHSDGSCKSQSGASVPCPLYKTVSTAAERKLDFIAITDHNTTSHYNEMRELQPYSDQLLLIPGREVTTFEGHANIFGTVNFVDFRLAVGHAQSIDELLAALVKEGAILSINHPAAPSGEACMGCGWTAPAVDYGQVAALEAVNGGTVTGPHSGIPFWEDLLKRGFHITAIGGSDNHDADKAAGTRSSIGVPTTVVYAEDLSQAEILTGIRAGHVFLDIQGCTARTLEFTAHAGSHSARMGDTIKAAVGVNIEFDVHVSQVPPGSKVRIVDDGQTASSISVAPLTGQDERRSFSLVSDGKTHYLRIEILSPDDHLILLGNPIYLE